MPQHMTGEFADIEPAQYHDATYLLKLGDIASVTASLFNSDINGKTMYLDSLHIADTEETNQAHELRIRMLNALNVHLREEQPGVRYLYQPLPKAPIVGALIGAYGDSAIKLARTRGTHDIFGRTTDKPVTAAFIGHDPAQPFWSVSAKLR